MTFAMQAGPSQVCATSSSVLLAAARLPAKLVARIESLDFVEMAELLQEAWPAESASDGAVQGLTLRLPRRSTPISDISVWVECYGLMAAVLCARYPARGPDMFMYLRRIVHCARKFEGQAWVTYDRLYRRQAAASRSLNWAIEDQLLYNEAFSGNAKPTLRCKQCLSEHHSTETCPDILRGWPLPNENPPARAQQEVCRRYNQERCHSRIVDSSTPAASVQGVIQRPGALGGQLSSDLALTCATAAAQKWALNRGHL